MAAVSTDAPTTLTNQQISALVNRTNRRLLGIIRNNVNTQYATQAPSLSEFRDAVSAHGDTENDATLLADFRAHIPFSNYDYYKPFMDRFDRQPCRKEDVENLFAPGLPEYLAISSATSGTTPKLLARYPPTEGLTLPRYSFLYPNDKSPLAAITYCGCIDSRELVDASGKVVKRIPTCMISGRTVRRCFGWEFDDDSSRVSDIIPQYAVPWAATIITQLPSFITVHGLFFLANRDIDRFYAPFATLFMDLIRCMDEQWDTHIRCIRDGILPDIEGIDNLREHLQAQFHADPRRAAELLEIGPPFTSVEGWVSRVWPRVTTVFTVCSGPWSLLLPKLRSILGPNILIHNPAYGSTESAVGVLHDVNKPEEFLLTSNSVVEFLGVSQDTVRENIHQMWEVEVGKRYELIVTTKQGLWRYQLGDIVTILGFHPTMNLPIFRFLGRKSVKMHLPHVQIADFQLLEAIKVSNSEDTIIVQEFTTMVDDRALPPTVGFFVELTRPPGPNAHLAPQKLFDALTATDAEHAHGQIPFPTIRVVRPGTFLGYRVWKAKSFNMSSGQIKLPSVLVDPTMQKLILEGVVQEL